MHTKFCFENFIVKKVVGSRRHRWKNNIKIDIRAGARRLVLSNHLKYSAVYLSWKEINFVTMTRNIRTMWRFWKKFYLNWNPFLLLQINDHDLNKISKEMYFNLARTNIFFVKHAALTILTPFGSYTQLPTQWSEDLVQYREGIGRGGRFLKTR
jgi:hypothetical protein